MAEAASFGEQSIALTDGVPQHNAERLGYHRRETIEDIFDGKAGECMNDSSYEEELKQREVRQKQWDAVVSAAVVEVEDAVLKRYPGFHHTTFFGAMGIDPKHLAIWCFFGKDEDLKRAEEERFTETIQNAMRDALRKHGYPGSLLGAFPVYFATDEDVQRTCGGNYWRYLK